MSLAQASRDVAKLAALPLPEGWSAEPHAPRWLVIMSPQAGAVTLDAEQHVIRPGFSVTHGRAINDTTQAGAAAIIGRGWHEKLHAAAVSWLKNLEQERIKMRQFSST